MPNLYPVLSLLKHINAKRSTAGPPIKLFRCNAEEKKKTDSRQGPLSMWGLHIFLMSA